MLGGSTGLLSSGESSQFEWRVFLLERNICQAQVWLEETSPGQGWPSPCTASCTSFFSQACVKERASKSMACVRELSESEAREVVDQVFDTCFTDTDPFERVPP